METPNSQHTVPLAYLITSSCYGTRLHGDLPESVDRRHNIPQSPFIPQALAVGSIEERQMKQRPYRMDRIRRPLSGKFARIAAGYSWPLTCVRHMPT